MQMRHFIYINASDRSVWSVGRVQTPTLCMICRRFLENKNFKVTPYFMLKVKTGKTGLDFWANNSTKFDDIQKAQAKMTEINVERTLTVVDVQKKPAYSNPPLLYDLTTIQKEANSKFGFSAEDLVHYVIHEMKFFPMILRFYFP